MIRRLAVTVAAVSTLGLGGAGLAAALTTGGGGARVGTSVGGAGLQATNGGQDPCILAISYAHLWGICIQPPTN
jgi:hypothetical protein